MPKNFNQWIIIGLIAYLILFLGGVVPGPGELLGSIPSSIPVTPYGAQPIVNGSDPTPFGSPIPVVFDPTQAASYLNQIMTQMPPMPTETPSNIVDQVLKNPQPTLDPILFMANIEVYHEAYQTSYMNVSEMPFSGIATVSQALGSTPQPNTTYSVIAVRVLTIPVGVQFDDIFDDATYAIDATTNTLQVGLNVKMCSLHPWEYRDDIRAKDISLPSEAMTWLAAHLNGNRIDYANVTTEALKAAWDQAVTRDHVQQVLYAGQSAVQNRSTAWFAFTQKMFDQSAKAAGLNGATVNINVATIDESSFLICGTQTSVFVDDQLNK